MSRGDKIVLALVLTHLILVAVGASQMRFLPAESWPSRLFSVYGTLTGANLGFNYFAFEIGSEVRSRFVLTDGRGKRHEDTFERGAGREARLRLANIVGLLGQTMDDETARRRLAASWAGKMLGRYPDAVRIAVVLEVYDLPTMAEYRQGRQPQWQPLYRGVFARKRKAEHDDEPVAGR